MEDYEEEDDSYDYRFRRQMYMYDEDIEAEVRDFYRSMDEDFPGWSGGL